MPKARKLKTKYKYIHFQEWLTGKGWYVKTNKNNTILASIYFYMEWNCFVFEGKEGCVFDTSCLTDIIDFMKQLKV